MGKRNKSNTNIWQNSASVVCRRESDFDETIAITNDIIQFDGHLDYNNIIAFELHYINVHLQ